jgi:hypothetical protein
MFVPISRSAPVVDRYDLIFDSLPTDVLENVSTHFTAEGGSVVGLPLASSLDTRRRASAIVLERLWMHCVAGEDAGENPLPLCKRIAPDIVDFDVVFVEQQAPRYLRSARLLRDRAGTAPIALHQRWQHPALGISFSVSLTIGYTAYVSIYDTRRSEYAYLYHMLAQAFDVRARVLINEAVNESALTDLTLPHGSTPFYRSQVLWMLAETLARAANIRMAGIVLVFDLEWSNPNLKTRYTQGVIVDAHFEDLTYGWVPFSGLVRVPAKTKLTPFLLEHNYNIKDINQNGVGVAELRDKVRMLHNICEKPLFSAFGGINSDKLVLETNFIYIDFFLDSCLFLTAGRLISLAAIYFDEFGESFSAHNAASDTTALLRIIRHRGITNKMLKIIFSNLTSMGAISYPSFPK